MPRYHLVSCTQPCWVPLDTLSRLCADRAALPELRPDDFMYMGCLMATEQPLIHLYKHVDTRRYLLLDDAGHCYRVLWSSTIPGEVTAACAPYRRLGDAITAVIDGASPKRPASDDHSA